MAVSTATASALLKRAVTVFGSPAGSLRARAVSGSIWTVAGHFGDQALRLAGNLVLTRLLFPEAFGLMALVQVVMQGLQMFADTGTAGSVIQSKRGNDPEFLNTAWTIQVIRGGALWVMTWLLAWPAAALYNQPELMWMIPVVGLQAVVGGFQSPAILSLQKNVHIRPIVIRDLVARTAALVVMVVAAIAWQSVWVLVIGAVLQIVSKTLLSYLLLPGLRPRFTWNPDAAREMFRFGRWIFLSTAVTFLLQQGDKLVLGTMITASELGVYAIAAFLSRAVLEAMLKLNRHVMFPVYSELANKSPERLRNRYLRARLTLLAMFLPPIWVLCIAGEPIVGFLYDSRYAQAGWMLQILSIGIIGAVVSVSAGSVLLAKGDSFRFMILQVTRGAMLIAGMALGGFLGGFEGLVIGVALSKLLDYPVLAVSVHRYRLWLPALDFCAFGISAAVIGLGWFIVS